MSVERYFEGDDVKLRGVFKVSGAEQTPASATVKVIKSDGTVITDTTATINGNDVEHIETALAEGSYIAYLTADFGDDKRTGTIPYRVVARDGQQS
jgi:hypothetical protein